MKTRMKNVLIALALVSTLSAQLSIVFAQGTAFTYQGHLNSGSGSANGSYDLQFTLYAINAGGVAIAGPVTNSATSVSNGLFTTAIDFGPNVFTGGSNWLDIAVRTNGAGTFNELTPRQQITPTPYAIMANSAATAASANSVLAGNISGTVALAQLPSVLVTNNATGVTLNSVTLSNATLSGELIMPAYLSGDLGLGTDLYMYLDAIDDFYAGGAGNTTTTGLGGNTGIGVGTLQFNVTGSANTAMGVGTLGANTSGANNTAIGYLALGQNYTGNKNTAEGYYALGNLGGNGLGGSNNIALGYQAGAYFTGNESSNIDIGNLGIAGENSTIRIGTTGIQTNAFIAGVINGNGGGLTNLSALQISGTIPLLVENPAVVTNNATGVTLNSVTLSNATLSGELIMPAYLSGDLGLGTDLYMYLDAIDDFYAGGAGNTTTTGLGGNTGIGVGTLQFNVTGSANTAMGVGTLGANTSGANNTAIGYLALGQNYTGNKNTAEGYYALGSLGGNGLGGSNNIALGYQAGAYFTGNESSNIDIGNLGIAGENSTIRIGTTGTQTNAFIAGVINGNGGGLTNLNAANLKGTLPSISGVNLTNLNPANLSAGTATINISGSATSATTADSAALATEATLADNVVSGIGITNAFLTGTTLTNTTFDFSPTITMTSGGLPFLYSDPANNLLIGLYGNLNSTLGGGAAGNTSLGAYAMEIISTGSCNTGIGDSALYSVNKGSDNTALGLEAFNNLTTGSNNIAVGYLAGFGLMGNENNNIYIGNQGNAGENNTIRIGTNGVETAAYIAGVINGNGSGLTNLNATNLKGTLPSISGANLTSLNPVSLSAGTAGIDISGNAETATTATLADNVVSGIGITNAFLTGTTLTNTTFDFSPTITMTSGGLPFLYSDPANNLLIGLYGNLHSTLGGGAAGNTSLGAYAMEIISTGSCNTGIGDSALYSVNKGSDNTALGLEAFNNLTTGSNNIAVGYLAGFGLMGNENNNIYIGNQGNAGENNTIRIGTNGVQTAAYIAGVINGNGSGLTNLSAGQVTGSFPDLTVNGSASGGYGTPLALIQNNNMSGNTAPALRVVGNGASPNGVLSVSSQGTGLIAQFGNGGAFVSDINTNGTYEGTIRVGSSGTTITNMEAGQAIMPSSTVQETNFTIAFPTAFSSSPKIIFSIANDPGFQGVSDVFSASISSNSPAAFSVNVYRLNGTSWSQQLRINWQAWQ